MQSAKRIPVVFSLIILFVISAASAANTHYYNLLDGLVSNPAEFKERKIGNRIVYWHQRKIGEAKVEKDYILYHFDSENHQLVDARMHWRDDLPSALPALNVTKEQAESMVEGTVEFSQLHILSPESTTFHIKPTPENPCWVVHSRDDAKGLLLTVIDAVEAVILGYGSPPPFTAFSLSGPAYENPCGQDVKWTGLYQDARDAFDTMGYFTEGVKWPSEQKVKSHIQSKTTAMFYELAHGGPEYFKSGCEDCFYEYTYAAEIEDWISDYTKMPFTFLASCEGMCDTNDGTLSYEFRKGSTEDTATVGYCHMDMLPCSDICWMYFIEDWQGAFFEYLNDGHTVKEAFDLANAYRPDCFPCMRFAGDTDFAVVPVVWRLAPPLLTLTKTDDVSDGNTVVPGDYINYTIFYDANGRDFNNVTIVDYLPPQVDYNGPYDPDYNESSHTCTWLIGSLEPNDSNSVTLSVRVNNSAEPNSQIHNNCAIESDTSYTTASEDTNTGYWPALIAHWKLDETGGIIAEDSVGNNHGTLNNFPANPWVTGKINGGLDFDGTNDYVSLVPVDALETTTVTISAWIKAETLDTGQRPIFAQCELNEMMLTYDGYYFYIDGDKPAFHLGSGLYCSQAVSPNSINDDTWYHIVGTNDGQNLKIYVDGVLMDTEDSTGLTGVNIDAYIGRDKSPYTSVYFEGIIDDVQVHNWAMSEDDLLNNADFNNDGVVNFIDYAMFAAKWQTDPNDPDFDEIYDLYNDNVIDMADLGIFVEDWLWVAGWAQEAMMMGGGMGMQEAVYSAPASEQAEPVDIKLLLEWFDGIWFDGDLAEFMAEDEYLEFRKSLESFFDE